MVKLSKRISNLRKTSLLSFLIGCLTLLPLLVLAAPFESAPGLLDILKNILSFILKAFTLLSVVALVITGITYLVSGGNTQTAEKAKKYLTYSIIGILVGTSSLIIILIIDTLLQ